MKKLSLSKILGLALGCAALALGAIYASADSKHSGSNEFSAHGGTTFVLTPIPGTTPQQYSHTVDGVYWNSLLGDCTFHAEATISVPTPPSDIWPITGGAFTITPLNGMGTLTASAEGAATANPAGTALDFHYNVKFTGGTGKLSGARGTGEIVEGIAALALSPGSEDFPGLTRVYPPNADLIDPNSLPGQSGDLTGKATWLMHGHLDF